MYEKFANVLKEESWKWSNKVVERRMGRGWGGGHRS